MNMQQKGTIVFVTGAFISHECWNDWKVYFRERGFEVYAPAWPNRNAPAEVLRNTKGDGTNVQLRLADVVGFYAAFIESLPVKPILIGHSLGGLLVQLLLQKQLAIAGIVLNSFTAKGVGLPTWKHVLRLSSSMHLWKAQPQLMPFERWIRLVCNGFACKEAKDSYYQLAIPESTRLLKDALLHNAPIDYHLSHVPLLFIAGGKDRLTPASLNYDNQVQYAVIGGICQHKLFAHSNHLTLIQKGWEDIAAYAYSWLHSNHII
jgi:pimeloyl-ACP methyl ester carboxylesterase